MQACQTMCGCRIACFVFATLVRWPPPIGDTLESDILRDGPHSDLKTTRQLPRVHRSRAGAPSGQFKTEIHHLQRPSPCPDGNHPWADHHRPRGGGRVERMLRTVSCLQTVRIYHPPRLLLWVGLTALQRHPSMVRRPAQSAGGARTAQVRRQRGQGQRARARCTTVVPYAWYGSRARQATVRAKAAQLTPAADVTTRHMPVMKVGPACSSVMS